MTISPRLAVQKKFHHNDSGYNGPGERNDSGERAESGFVPQMAVQGDSVMAIAAVLLVGLVLGAVVGGLTTFLAGASPTASALVQLTVVSDPGLAALQQTDQSQSAATDFSAAELAWLSGGGLETTVAHRLGTATAPTITVERVGQSSVVKFTTRQATEQEALRVVQAAVDVYTERRAAHSKQQLQAALTAVDQALTELTSNEPAANGGASVQAGIDRLSSLRAELLLLSYRDGNVVGVLQPPLPGNGSGPSGRLLGIVLGALGGGLVAVGAFACWRARTATLLHPADASAVVKRVLHPQVRLARRWSSAAFLANPHQDRHVPRMLATQLAGRRSLAGQVIAVLGVSPRSGSAAVATMIAVGIADQTPTILAQFGRHPVDTKPAETKPTKGNGQCLERIPSGVDNLTLVEFGDLTHPIDVTSARLARLVGAAKAESRCLVVAAGWFGNSPDVLRLLPPTAELVLTLGVGVDTLPEAAAAMAAARADDDRIVAVVTRAWWGRWLSRWTGKQRNGRSPS